MTYSVASLFHIPDLQGMLSANEAFRPTPLDFTETRRCKQMKMGERKKAEEENKTAISWPLIKPKSNLSITRLKGNDLFTVQNFFTSSESKGFIKVAESIGFTHQGSLGPSKGEAFRDNDRISFNDPVLAYTIWASGFDKLLSDFKIRSKVAVGLNPNIRLYRYKAGQCFGQHIDESVDLGEGKRTHYTLLIYLSGGSKPKSKKNSNALQDDASSETLVGGETVFYGHRNSIVAEVPPTEGMALLHIHGHMCMLHEAQKVTKGIKYVLRSDVVFA